MTAKLIDGKAVAQTMREEIKKEVARLPEKPGLAAILVGDSPASEVYVGIKQKTCAEVGIYSEKYRLPEETSEEELLELVRKLNRAAHIHAILVQLPLPRHISEERVFEEILPEKDVDGFSARNMSKLLRGNESILPCTPLGIVQLLEKNAIAVAGKHAVVVGRSSIVGKPAALMLLNRNATVTLCHSKTRQLDTLTKQADILIAAVGRPKFITADMVKEGAVVIDVGISKKDGKIMGDVDFEAVKEKASWITPVPGGVGPMTVAMLLQNTLTLYKRQHEV